MAVIQPFLRRLGLDHSADEPAIRRAYAQLLKATDPAEDPRGFQSLREAYEAAMAWVKRARPPAPRAPQGTVGGAPPAAPALADLNIPRAEPSTDEAPAQAPALPPSPASGDPPPPLPPPKGAVPLPASKEPKAPVRRPSPHGLADVVFNSLRQRADAWSDRIPPRAEALAQAELEACLRDPRLFNLVARQRFEQRIVDHLVHPSAPGRKALLPAAARTFGWIKDRRRLDRFGSSGQKLNHEIDSTSLIVLGESVGYGASLLQKWRYYRARQKRTRAWNGNKGWRPRKNRIWLVAVIYAVLVLIRLLTQ